VKFLGALRDRLTDKLQRNNLRVTLNDGVMVDSLGRTGYIAANYQFQFDGPAQVCQDAAVIASSASLFADELVVVAGWSALHGWILLLLQWKHRSGLLGHVLRVSLRKLLQSVRPLVGSAMQANEHGLARSLRADVHHHAPSNRCICRLDCCFD
jgi:hypothetical protein